KILHKNKKYCLKMYHELGYSSEITFEEFFIWWYHFIYTQTTDVMHARALLKVPEGGNFFYKAE
ncbi:MAG TPA: hypothetical protein VK470_13050, partial [Bacteroidota bacterium]|nr:hypothetical protein [Bacteroidota bacterium]